MSDLKSPIWRNILSSSIKKEGRTSSSRWIQIATISKNLQPNLRTVVFRGWGKDDSMLIYTDNRTQKMKDLNTNNNVEILWLFFKSKSQYRFKGKVHEIKENNNYWINLSNESKSTWFWPAPGEKVVERSNINIPFNLYKPNNFTVLEVNIYQVDLLVLEQPIHKRYCWEKNNEWEYKEINP